MTPCHIREAMRLRVPPDMAFAVVGPIGLLSRARCPRTMSAVPARVRRCAAIQHAPQQAHCHYCVIAGAARPHGAENAEERS